MVSIATALSQKAGPLGPPVAMLKRTHLPNTGSSLLPASR